MYFLIRSDNKCGDGFLKIYIKGQEVIQAYDKADFEFCGKEVPHDVVSDGLRLVLVFSSGETQGSGFKARYVFETGKIKTKTISYVPKCFS